MQPVRYLTLSALISCREEKEDVSIKDRGLGSFTKRKTAGDFVYYVAESD